jgi:ribosomal protein S21
LNEVKERMEYNKPSIHRKVAKGRAVKRWQKKQEKTHLEGKSKKY